MLLSNYVQWLLSTVPPHDDHDDGAACFLTFTGFSRLGFEFATTGDFEILTTWEAVEAPLASHGLGEAGLHSLRQMQRLAQLGSTPLTDVPFHLIDSTLFCLCQPSLDLLERNLTSLTKQLCSAGQLSERI
jgi:hypothetical protein